LRTCSPAMNREESARDRSPVAASSCGAAAGDRPRAGSWKDSDGPPRSGLVVSSRGDGRPLDSWPGEMTIADCVVQRFAIEPGSEGMNSQAEKRSREPPLPEGRDAFHCVPDFCGKDGDAVERVPTGFMGGEHVRKDEAAFHEPARGLQSAGTWDRPTRLEFSTASDVPTVLRTEVRVPRPVHGLDSRPIFGGSPSPSTSVREGRLPACRPARKNSVKRWLRAARDFATSPPVADAGGTPDSQRKE
jgi:hypothetical protein